jgi:GNAT superfamily N-acetyltransferase
MAVDNNLYPNYSDTVNGGISMEFAFGEYKISDDKLLLDLKIINGFLQRSYWANQRESGITEKAIRNSHCFGAYDPEGRQVAFARVVTDYATIFYLCDVFIDEGHRGKGLGTAMVGYIVESEEYRGMRGLLGTADAHGLYKKFGFELIPPDRYMGKPPSVR